MKVKIVGEIERNFTIHLTSNAQSSPLSLPSGVQTLDPLRLELRPEDL
jgi:hypothetical protein